MKNNGKIVFYNILNYIHVIFWLSLLSVLTIYLTLGILLIPSLTSVYIIGKEIILGDYDMTDSVFKRFFGGVRSRIGMMRYFPLQIIFCLEAAGVYAGHITGMSIISYVCTVLMSLVLTYTIYICLCRVHMEQKCDLITVAVIMLYSLPSALSIWLILTIVCLFFCPAVMIASLLIGALVLIVMQGVAMIGILKFKEDTSQLTEKEKTLIARLLPGERS
ncbi:MAG: hypothetical protein IKR73_07145 [Oscillospiraceae bacterium]|nr:hypothetical protein [Oscillospiraceae bacterium]